MQGLGAWAGRPRPQPALSEPVPRLHPPGQPSGTEGLCWQPGPGTPVRSGVCLPNPVAACPAPCHKPHKPWGRVEKPSFVVQVRVPTPGSHAVLPGGQERAAHQSPPPPGPRPHRGVRVCLAAGERGPPAAAWAEGPGLAGPVWARGSCLAERVRGQGTAGWFPGGAHPRGPGVRAAAWPWATPVPRGAEAGQAATACEPRGLLRGWNRSGQAGPGDPGPTSVPGRPRAEAVDEDLSQACHARAPAPWPLASWKEGGEGRDGTPCGGEEEDAEQRDGQGEATGSGSGGGQRSRGGQEDDGPGAGGGRASQAGWRPADLGCALRAASSDSFFSRFFSSSGNFS